MQSRRVIRSGDPRGVPLSSPVQNNNDWNPPPRPEQPTDPGNTSVDLDALAALIVGKLDREKFRGPAGPEGPQGPPGEPADVTAVNTAIAQAAAASEANTVNMLSNVLEYVFAEDPTGIVIDDPAQVELAERWRMLVRSQRFKFKLPAGTRVPLQ